MKQQCVVCDKDINLNEDEYFLGYSLGSYWCWKCAENEGKED